MLVPCLCLLEVEIVEEVFVVMHGFCCCIFSCSTDIYWRRLAICDISCGITCCCVILFVMCWMTSLVVSSVSPFGCNADWTPSMTSCASLVELNCNSWICRSPDSLSSWCAWQYCVLKFAHVFFYKNQGICCFGGLFWYNKFLCKKSSYW